jgi:hypothetical protein
MTDSQEDPRTPEGAPVTVTPSLMRDLAVAVDGSPPSREGLRLAADIARRTGARVTAVHIRHAPALEEMGSEAGGISLEETLAGVEQAARQDAMDIFGEASAGWRFVVRTGSPGARSSRQPRSSRSTSSSSAASRTQRCTIWCSARPLSTWWHARRFRSSWPAEPSGSPAGSPEYGEPTALKSRRRNAQAVRPLLS